VLSSEGEVLRFSPYHPTSAGVAVASGGETVSPEYLNFARRFALTPEL